MTNIKTNRKKRAHMKSLKQNHLQSNNKYTSTVPIIGMHCASCELLITKKIESISSVESVNVSLKTNLVTIVSAKRIPETVIATAIQDAGYEVGIETSEKPLITRNRQIWKDLAIGLAIVIFLFLIFKVLNVDKILGTMSSGGSNGTMALVVGLTAGFSTCMALVGGLVLSVSSKYAENHPTETAFQKFRPHLVFNLGRIVSFIVFGAIIGTIGSAFLIKGSLLGLLTIAVGVVMLVLGLQLTEAFPRIKKSFTLPSGLAKKLNIKQNVEREYSHKNAFFMGTATFFLPCGFTQAMQLLAVSTGSPLQAALIMGAFAIGTTPGLLSLGGLTSIVKDKFAQRFFRVVGIIVVVMAMINLVNGYNLMGLNRVFEHSNLPTQSQTTSKQDSAGSVILNTVFKYDTDISPNTFTAKVGQKTTLVVDVQEDGQGCMSTIMIIGLNDTPQYLKKGKKLELTFTATEAGDYTIACAMGVPRGSIKVIK